MRAKPLFLYWEIKTSALAARDRIGECNHHQSGHSRAHPRDKGGRFPRREQSSTLGLSFREEASGCEGARIARDSVFLRRGIQVQCSVRAAAPELLWLHAHLWLSSPREWKVRSIIFIPIARVSSLSSESPAPSLLVSPADERSKGSEYAAKRH